MSTEREELAVIASDQIGYECRHTGMPDESVPGECPPCYELGGKVADAVLAAGWSRPRVITTAQELDVLGLEAVVLDSHNSPAMCQVAGRGGNGWVYPGMSMDLLSSWSIAENGPLTVLSEGTALKRILTSEEQGEHGHD